NAEGSIEDENTLFDCRQEKNPGLRINGGLELRSSEWFERQRDGFVAFRSGRIYVNIRRKPYLRSERDTVSRKCNAIRLRHRELDMRCFNRVCHFLSQF